MWILLKATVPQPPPPLPERSQCKPTVTESIDNHSGILICAPRYLICREGTLEGTQPKRAHNIIEPVKDHIKGLVLMQTWQRGDREVKAWLGGDRGDKGRWRRGMRALTWEMCCGEGWDSLYKGARLDRRREEKNKMVKRKRGFCKNSTSRSCKQSKKISEIGL